jgi:hypothetical protein
MAKVDWSRKLTEPIEIGRRKLTSLADVRSHILSLPEDRQRKAVWQNAAECLLNAAEGGDPTHVSVALRFARMLDR